MTDDRRIAVAAGILCDAAGRILIAERRGDGPFAGLYEFPGGKIDTGEAAASALQRELLEELGIEIDSAAPFMQLEHDYPDRRVAIEFFMVSAWRGEVQGLEGQDLRWVPVASLDARVLLPADAPVVTALQKWSARRRPD